ncbi:MAG: hypothetical protein JXA25_17220 [Anaerolineales bacterium]|nr:hypothetical protein [Anaerolineales bacterium]
MQPSIFVIAPMLFVLMLFYLIFFRPWQLRWGATDDEIYRSMQGDDIVEKPSFNATRAVTINAPAENIYPWIVQMGLNRAGWYSYDLLDNLARKSAESILPEYQNLQIGDLIPMSPDGMYGVWVKDFRKNHWVLWWDKNGDTSWVWEIYPERENLCRLVTRVRMKYRWMSFSAPFNLLIEFFDFPMMRKCLLGIKKTCRSNITFPTVSGLTNPAPDAADAAMF